MFLNMHSATNSLCFQGKKNKTPRNADFYVELFKFYVLTKIIVQAKESIFRGWIWLWASSLRPLSNLKDWSYQANVISLNLGQLPNHRMPPTLPEKYWTQSKLPKSILKIPRGVLKGLWPRLLPWHWPRVSGRLRLTLASPSEGIRN